MIDKIPILIIGIVLGILAMIAAEDILWRWKALSIAFFILLNLAMIGLIYLRERLDASCTKDEEVKE